VWEKWLFISEKRYKRFLDAKHTSSETGTYDGYVVLLVANKNSREVKVTNKMLHRNNISRAPREIAKMMGYQSWKEFNIKSFFINSHPDCRCKPCQKLFKNMKVLSSESGRLLKLI